MIHHSVQQIIKYSTFHAASIGYSNVHFSYPTRNDVEVLKGVDFDIKPGQKVALVGQSGAGKSTIIQLLMRFYDPISGKIIIGGNAISDINLNLFKKSYWDSPPGSDSLRGYN